MENPKEDYMQLQGGKHGSHNMKETKSSNYLWINRWLDYHQNKEKCGIVEKDDTQTLDDIVVFIQLHCVIETLLGKCGVVH